MWRGAFLHCDGEKQLFRSTRFTFLKRCLWCGLLLAFLAFAVSCKRSRPRPAPPPQTTSSRPDQPVSASPDPNAPAPEIDIRVEPSVVAPAGPALLSWEARHTDRVTIDHDIGPVMTVGGIQLFPEETTTYKVVAEGPGGVIEKSVTVAVRVAGAGLDEETEALSIQQRFDTFVKPIYFKFDRADLSDEARLTLDGNIRWLLDHKTLRFEVQGHCDPRGTEEYNLALGDRRAQAVRA